MANETVTIYQVTKTRVSKYVGTSMVDLGYVQVTEHDSLPFAPPFDPHATVEEARYRVHDLPIQCARASRELRSGRVVHNDTFFAVNIADEDLALINLKERESWRRKVGEQASYITTLEGRVQYWTDQTFVFLRAPWYRRLWMAITGRLPIPSEPALGSPSAPSSPGGQPG